MLLTITEVARDLQVHPATVKRWIRDGHLLAVRLPGGSYRVEPRELGKLLK